ncbi:MAG: hypothetical protein IT539_01535 [Bradyrhizobiaceae bacterium]|nr:hypothetical protein [Bradyrhizobiaceae bacterium]
MRRLLFLTAALALLGSSAAYIALRAEHALALRLAADEPERLADLRLAATFNAEVARREIEVALAYDDVELAESFVELARVRRVPLGDDLLARVAQAQTVKEQARRIASRFGKGFITGEPEGVEGLAGAAAGDLLVFGDIRDLAREGTHWARGQAVDPWIAGLAAAGLAVTAGTYFASAAAPARAGVSLFKAAQRTGRISANLATDMTRLVRTGSTARTANVLVDLGRIEGKAGVRTALEGLRHADNVEDIAKVGRLAEKNGRTTLAILKTLGRGALALGAGAVTGALWVIGATANIFFLVLTLSTLFAILARWLWRAGRLAFRGGRYLAVRVAATA